MDENQRKIVVIVGPTGSGKTTLGLTLAKTLTSEIISADSRQIFIGADIGTNKISSGTNTLEKHRDYWKIDNSIVNLYDVVYPDEEYSVGVFVKQATGLIEKIWQDDSIPLVVGGTGFYIDALIGNRPFSQVPQNAKARKGWGSETPEEIFELLKQHDKEFAKQLPSEVRNNKQRIIRYLELALAKGSVSDAAEWSTLKNNANVLWIGLTTDRQVLHEKANAWVLSIFENGLIEETQELLDKGYGDTVLLNGLIYQPTVEYIHGIINKQKAIERIKSQLHAYIKRQHTWFNRNKKINWFDIRQAEYSQQINQLVESFIKE